MLGLFEKKKDPQERAAKCLEKKDWDGLSRAYYDMGVAAMESGDLNSAVLWLSRADTVYSASDEVYSKTSKNRLFHKEVRPYTTAPTASGPWRRPPCCIMIFPQKWRRERRN